MAWALAGFFSIFVLIGIFAYVDVSFWLYLFGFTVCLCLFILVHFAEKMHDNITKMTDYSYRIHVDTRDTCEAMERVSPPPEDENEDQDDEPDPRPRKKKGNNKNV